jgi:hypothetical protein
MGEQGFSIQQLREYVVLYANTHKYIGEYTGESDLLREMYPKFPDIEPKEFKDKGDKVVSYIEWFFTALSRRGADEEPEDLNPEVQAFYDHVMEQVPQITMLCNEMIDRLAD